MESELTGKGVSYCATCDGAFFRDVPVAVGGGGNTALEEALFLTRFASRVYVVRRRDEFRGVKYIQEKVFADEKIEPVWNSVVEEIEGSGAVTGVRLRDVVSGETSRLEVEGAFIFVGVTPNTEFLGDFLPMNERGFLPAGENMETGVPGVFVASDVRAKALRQIVTAVGEGALAATTADHYLGWKPVIIFASAFSPAALLLSPSPCGKRTAGEAPVQMSVLFFASKMSRTIEPSSKS